MDSIYYSSYEQSLPALDYSSPASSSSYSTSSADWPSYLSPDSFLLTPSCTADGQRFRDSSYFDYVPAKPEPTTPSLWEVYQPEPQRFPSGQPSSSLLLSPTYEEAAYPLQPSPPVASPKPSAKAVAEPSSEPTLAEDIDDVIFAQRRPTAALASIDNSHDISPRNKQACVYCQSGRRKCDGNKNNLTACTVCAVAGRDCCWTKVKRLRGPNRARGDDGKPALPSSAYRVRTAGLLLKRIEEQQRQQRSSAAPSFVIQVEQPAASVEIDDFIGADGWEPSTADGFQVSSAVFALDRPHHAYPATPRPPTQALPSVFLPYDHKTTHATSLPTPYDPSMVTGSSSPESIARARLNRFTFPYTATAPLTPPPSLSHPITSECRPPSIDTAASRSSLKRACPTEDDGHWSPQAPAAKMNRALAIDIAGQRISYTPSYDVSVY